MDLLYYRGERPLRSVLREKREPQAGPASCLSNAASIVQEASGDVRGSAHFAQRRFFVALPERCAASRET